MRTYLIVSSVFFDLLATVQLVRFVLGWPVVVAGFSVPVWASAVAFLVVGALAAWGSRLLLKSRPQLAAV